MKLNAKQLRNLSESEAKSRLASHKRKPLFFILENIYDTYNVGGLFRLADALNIEKIYLCGQTEIPPNHKIIKASIGTYKIVPWEYKDSAREVIEELKKKGVFIAAVEQAQGSMDYRKATFKAPLALVVGNETGGVEAETLKLCDQIWEIPMWGVNASLNVIVSAAIVAYSLTGR